MNAILVAFVVVDVVDVVVVVVVVEVVLVVDEVSSVVLTKDLSISEFDKCSWCSGGLSPVDALLVMSSSNSVLLLLSLLLYRFNTLSFNFEDTEVRFSFENSLSF